MVSIRDPIAPPIAGAPTLDVHTLRRQHLRMKTDAITDLRRSSFRLIDEALETGEPTVLNRKGKGGASYFLSPGRGGLGCNDRLRSREFIHVKSCFD